MHHKVYQTCYHQTMSVYIGAAILKILRIYRWLVIGWRLHIMLLDIKPLSYISEHTACMLYISRTRTRTVTLIYSLHKLQMTGTILLSAPSNFKIDIDVCCLPYRCPLSPSVLVDLCCYFCITCFILSCSVCVCSIFYVHSLCSIP